MLSEPQRLFLGCLSDFLKGIPSTENVTGSGWDELMKTAYAQSLEAIAFHQFKDRFPEEIKRRYYKRYLAHIVVSIKRKEFLEELTGYAKEESVPLICMKGSVFRDHYPVPALRNMSDMDIIIREEDRDTVDTILRQKMGYDCSMDSHDVWTYWRGNLYTEIHTHMFYDNLANQVDYRSYFDQVWDHCRQGQVFGIESDNLYVPEEGFHFLYLMAHLAKHIMNSGSGFRSFLDIVLMSRGCQELDWELMEQELEKLELLIFTRTCMGLCEKWFDVEMPLHLDNMDETFYGSITEKTFRDGVFGLGNIENKTAGAAKDIKQSEGPYYLAALKRGIRMLFPSYRNMQLIPWYSFVDGRPWLMPAAWIYRLYYCLSHKRKHSTEVLTEPFTRKKDVRRRQAYLERWGL